MVMVFFSEGTSVVIIRRATLAVILLILRNYVHIPADCWALFAKLLREQYHFLQPKIPCLLLIQKKVIFLVSFPLFSGGRRGLDIKNSARDSETSKVDAINESL